MRLRGDEDMSIDPISDLYVLEGRVVTMGEQGVIPKGAIYIDNGEIKAVQDVEETAPDGFEGAPRVRTGDTIYPGLIELHNHLSYNVMPLWDVPRKYGNNGQWRGIDEYRRNITKPTQVLGSTPGVVEALVRYVECRALLGGVTTSQGISLSTNKGIERYYKGIVRNVEQPLDPNLTRAGTNIGNPKSNRAVEYLEKLEKHSAKGQCYLQHMSEGVDATARRWFLRLKIGENDWAVNDAFCGIHSTALNREDLEAIAERDGSMIWSPTSNYLLYGDTIDLGATKDSGILMGLGSDWSPSGTKNLLGELKVAYIASKQALGETPTEGNEVGVFTPKEIVEMTTINPARIAKWNALLGSIGAGKRADLLVVNGQCKGPESDEDYMRLIRARETSITLVVIDGVPRVGQVGLMNRFTGPTEDLTIKRSRRKLNLHQDTADELVGALTLEEAIDRLETAMADLPQLAAQLDANNAMGIFSGSAGLLSQKGVTHRLLPDFEEEDKTIEHAMGVASVPYSQYVTQGMELDGITVADDRGHLRTLVRARNLPEFVKQELPPLYGQRVPIPTDAAFLDVPDKAKKFAPQVLSSTSDLKTFLRTWGHLTLEGRERIVDQALILLGENYVHLPLKRSMHAVDPMQRLRLLKHRLDESTDADMPPEIEFHNELSSIFNSLRDLHTGYRLPWPFSIKTAWLPFFIEEYWELDKRHYIISKVVDDASLGHLKEVEVTHWNGTPIHQVVTQNAERNAGSNMAARHARGLNSLTIRPLARSFPPEEDWVTIGYRDKDGNEKEWTQEWLVYEPGMGNRLSPNALLLESSVMGLDDHTDDVQEVKKALYAPKVAIQEAKGITGEVKNTKKGLGTTMPSAFRAKPVKSIDGTEYGYIRIFTFNVRDADEFVDEFIRLVEQLPKNGLIIDVRGNGGGLIYAAEQLLQVLTPQLVEPQRAQFINTPLNLKMCRNHRRSSNFPGLMLDDWIPSISQSVETGATYSLGYHISSPGKCREIGQRYYGPVVLITDALCYSATDMFAAGFQDHGIGKVLGIADNTGAGGANVWSHGLLQMLMEPDNEQNIVSPYLPLPYGADMRVAIRRTLRVGPNAGDVVEDLGVIPDERHCMSFDDVTNGNADLLERAMSILARERTYNLDVDKRPRSGRPPRLKITTRNVTRLEPTVNGRQLHWRDIGGDQTTLDLETELGPIDSGQVMVELTGYDEEDSLVVRWRDLISWD
jgi:cytosine/adenosine deaminase-related metal-dependent hydrolase